MRQTGIPVFAIVNLNRFAEYISVMTGREICAILEGSLEIDARQIALWAGRMRQEQPRSTVEAVRGAMSQQHSR